MKYCYNSLGKFIDASYNLMSHSSSPSPVSEQPTSESTTQPAPETGQPPDSYVKLAMRNMVRKRGTSLKHFALTTISLLTILIGLSYLTR